MTLMGFDEFCRKWEIYPYGEERVEFDDFNVDYIKDNEGQEFLSICSRYYSGKIICKNDNNKMNVKIISDYFRLADLTPKRDFDLFNDLDLYACFGYSLMKLGSYTYKCSVTPVYNIDEKAGLYFNCDEPEMLDNSRTSTFDIAYNKINKFLELIDYSERYKNKIYIDMVVEMLREEIKERDCLDNSLLEMSDEEIWEDWCKDPNDKTKKINDDWYISSSDNDDVDDKYAKYIWENVI